jgi:hypothetical protein
MFPQPFALLVEESVMVWSLTSQNRAVSRFLSTLLFMSGTENYHVGKAVSGHTSFPLLYPVQDTTTSPLHSLWNMGLNNLPSKAVSEVSVAFKFFVETGLLALCSNPQPGGPGLLIYIPWGLGGPVVPPDTEYPF